MKDSLRVELARLLSWKRWVLAAAILAVVAALEANEATAGGVIDVNQWDVILDLLNQITVVIWILLPVFVGLVGDIAMDDRRTGYASLSYPRVGSRAHWWRAKLTAVLVAAVLFLVLVCSVTGLVGAAITDPEWGLSEYGKAQFDPSGTVEEVKKLYSPPPFQTVPLLGVAIVASYTAVAMFGLTSTVLTLTLLWPRPWTPLVGTLVISLIFWRVTPTNISHPLIHLLWDTHTFSVSNVAVDWWASGAYIALQLSGALVIGTLILKRADI